MQVAYAILCSKSLLKKKSIVHLMCMKREDNVHLKNSPYSKSFIDIIL